jgi:hypothetical protein
MTAFTGLDDAMIQELLGKSRTRNAYGPKLADFYESDEAAINVAETWPVEFGKKAPATLAQGFNIAADKADMKDKVQIINRGRAGFPAQPREGRAAFAA